MLFGAPVADALAVYGQASVFSCKIQNWGRGGFRGEDWPSRVPVRPSSGLSHGAESPRGEDAALSAADAGRQAAGALPGPGRPRPPRSGAAEPALHGVHPEEAAGAAAAAVLQGEVSAQRGAGARAGPIPRRSRAATREPAAGLAHPEAAARAPAGVAGWGSAGWTFPGWIAAPGLGRPSANRRPPVRGVAAAARSPRLFTANLSPKASAPRGRESASRKAPLEKSHGPAPHTLCTERWTLS